MMGNISKTPSSGDQGDRKSVVVDFSQIQGPQTVEIANQQARIKPEFSKEVQADIVQKELEIQKDINTQKFEDIVQDNHKVMLAVKGFFPFDLFPNEVVVDLKKVTIVKRDFFYKRVHSIYIQDISDVLVHSGIFFASLQIVDKFFRQNSFTINFLPKAEAYRARDLIQGLIVGNRELDMSKVDVKNFEEKVEDLGAVQEPIPENLLTDGFFN